MSCGGNTFFGESMTPFQYCLRIVEVISVSCSELLPFVAASWTSKQQRMKLACMVRDGKEHGIGLDDTLRSHCLGEHGGALIL